MKDPHTRFVEAVEWGLAKWRATASLKTHETMNAIEIAAIEAQYGMPVVPRPKPPEVTDEGSSQSQE